MERNIEQLSTRSVDIDDLSYDFIAHTHKRFQDKLFHPEGTRDLNHLLALRNQWRDEGAVTVFTSGVYDMLNLDHSAYLLHAKATGAALLYERHRSQDEAAWHALSPEEKHAHVSHALGSQLLRLVVSVDGDMSVAVRKGFKPEKGNVPRPIYSWETRATVVASQAFLSLPGASDSLVPIADAVTVHGPDDFPPTSPHSSHMQLVEQLQPDVWTIFGESEDILEEAPRRPGLGSVALKCIMDGADSRYYNDALVGAMSTTNVVKRMTGRQE